MYISNDTGWCIDKNYNHKIAVCPLIERSLEIFMEGRQIFMFKYRIIYAL